MQARRKYIMPTHTHTHTFQWDTLDKYKNLSTAQYTDFALYGHCGRYKTHSWMQQRSPLHKLYIRTSFCTAVCAALFQKKHFTITMRGKWVESNVIGNKNGLMHCLHIKAFIWDGKSMLEKFELNLSLVKKHNFTSIKKIH